MDIEERERRAEERRFYRMLCDPCKAIPALFGFELWEKQQEIARSIVENERTTVRACHSSGKTALAARLALWWLTRYPNNSKVVTTAPTDNQVRRLLWGELHSAVRKAQELETIELPTPNQVELKLAENWWAYGFSTSVQGEDQGVKFQGFHSPHILIIFDESVGIHSQIWNSLEGILSSGHARFLCLCNPTVPSGPAYETFSDPNYNAIGISAFDTPNLKGLTLEELVSWDKNDPRLDDSPYPSLSRRWVYGRYFKWGEEHPYFQSRVLGRFPTQSKYSLFPLSLLESAKVRVSSPQVSEFRAVGIDVAGSGDNETVVTLRSGSRVLGIWSWRTPDPRGEVTRLLKALMPLNLINVDSIGIGYNFGLHLADSFGLYEQGGIVQLVNVGLPSIEPQRFLNRKAEFYWGLSDLFKDCICFTEQSQTGNYDGDIINAIKGSSCTSGSETVELAIAQLASLQYEAMPKGQTKMESKQSMEKRGIASPDYAESFMLAFVPPLPLTEGTNIYEHRSDYEISQY